jgi:uncharacterized protein (TIGR02453 family)
MTATDAPADAFAGFPDEALSFYDGLEADNSKTYWSDRREVYERCVRRPMLALLAQLEPEFGPAGVFRPHRDVRFSADRSPYKTHVGALVRDEGGGSLYVQVSAAGLLAAGGAYSFSRDQLSRYREVVGAEGAAGEALAQLVAGLTGEGFDLIGEALRRGPRGVEPAHPRIELLRRKGMAASRDHGVEPWLGTADCAEVVARTWRRVAPLNAWLARHVGPAEPVEGDQRRARPGRVSARGGAV